MYIEPNGTVKLLSNIPLDSDYNDTIYFNSRDAQYNYFYNHSGITLLTRQSYTRVDKGIFRCSLPMSQTYNINYMMFKNTSFENKWFYAFVNSISYTNNGLCEIHFSIDVIQTWMFNGSMQNALGECFVEREIVSDDTVGAHIEPEGIDVGEQVYNNVLDTLAMTGVVRYVVMLTDNDYTVANGRFYDGVFCGTDLYVCDSTGIYSVLNKVNTPDELAGIYTAPSEIFNSTAITLNNLVPTNYDPPSQSVSASGASFGNHGNTVDGYTPKNNKLLTYPFNYFVAMTGTGKTAIYPYEFFKNGTPTFVIHYNLLPPVSAKLEPTNYKNISTAMSVHNDFLTLDDYPTCAWNSDAYKMWQIQQGTVNQTNQKISSAGNIIGAIGNAASIAAGIITGNPLMAIGGSVGAGHTMISEYQNVKNSENAQYLASYLADICRGNISSGSNSLSNGEMKFFGGRMSVKSQRAKQIDDYFSMFGYSIRRVKQPNISSRPMWNYVKCTDANINAPMPTDDKNIIKNIFSNGIRFWKNGADVGNFSLDNK